jgi:hypothetical protein
MVGTGKENLERCHAKNKKWKTKNKINTLFVSDILMPEEPNRTDRVCFDYRNLNAIVNDNIYTMPILDK